MAAFSEPCEFNLFAMRAEFDISKFSGYFFFCFCKVDCFLRRFVQIEGQ